MLLRGFSSLSSGRAVQRNRHGSPGKEDALDVLEVHINVCMVEGITGKREEVVYFE
jgi:hypothetical protein